VPVQRDGERISAARLRSIATRLLNASTLCAISSVGPTGRAHINTAYFAWSSALEIVWLSAPEARHSRNIRSDPSVAIAVYDSTQKWGGSDRGIQLFGRAREVSSRKARDAAARLYAARFRPYSRDELETYRFYRFSARTLKLFHEREFGGATFVTAKVARDGRLAWDRTEAYVR
jgi:uncharacterized protein YhbP (UPF0306 family)